MVATCLFSLFRPIDGHADPLALGPFAGKAVLYGVTTAFTVDLAMDVTTTALGGHIGGDGRVSVNRNDLNSNIEKISKSVLPVDVAAGPCKFKIAGIASTDLSVSGNTVFLKTILSISPSGCPLSQGDVSLAARFVPQFTPTQLSIKVVDVQAQTPFEWNFLAFFAGKSPPQEIARAISVEVGALHFDMPTLNHARAAFQGASVDAQGDNLVLRLRADLQADREAFMDELTKNDVVRNLTVKFP